MMSSLRIYIYASFGLNELTECFDNYFVWLRKSLKVFLNQLHIDGLVQERRNSIANALELRLSYTNPSIFSYTYTSKFHVILVHDTYGTTESKVHGANMGPTWVLSVPDGPHVGPMNLAIRDSCWHSVLRMRVNLSPQLQVRKNATKLTYEPDAIGCSIWPNLSMLICSDQLGHWWLRLWLPFQWEAII